MATQSVEQDVYGPDWPLGLIVVATPGTPVGIMSLVDPSSVDSPTTPTGPPATGQAEYSPNCQQVIFQGFKASTNGLQLNTGNVYIVRKGVQGAGNRSDYGAMVACVLPGQTVIIGAAPRVLNGFSPYRYSIDADNAGDSCLVTLVCG
jgi:hypothetical protein